MLRVRVELLPLGIDAEGYTQVLEEIFVTNDGTGRESGENRAHEGGHGNYYINDHDPRYKDYPEEQSIGRLDNIERTPTHRLELAARALDLVLEERRAQGD